ncbi:MAG: diphthamide synthesis protein [Nanoarchaeota archaeon]
MKTLFIHARSTIPVELPLEDIRQIPQPVGVFTSIQFLDRINEFAKEVKGIPAGQVLGCKTEAVDRIAGDVAAFLYIGSGRFHPIGAAMSTGKPVFCFDPSTKVLSQIEDVEIEAQKNRQRGAVMRFLNSTSVGVLVSTKPGQNKMDQALAFKRACKDKKVAIFAFDTLDRAYLDNFTFIESWVNTSCPRLPETLGAGIVNLKDVLDACPRYNDSSES